MYTGSPAFDLTKHSSRNMQRNFDPPQKPPKMGYPGTGGGLGVKIKKIIAGSFPKMIILQRVKHPVPYFGVSANDHQKVYGVRACA